jgi:TolB protein
VPSEGSPSWSPEGARIVFYSERDGNSEIYVMRANGDDRRRLTDHPASDGYPSFSSDGKRIAFDSDRDGNFEIYVIAADGTNTRRLTNHPSRDVAASFSPDGSQIAFMSDRTGSFQIWLMNADGSEPRQLTDFGTNWFPQWSPDGGLLAFHVGRDVHVLDIAKKRIARLTIDPNNGMYPSWSPDGKRLAFMSWRTGRTEIYSMDADGTNPKRLTHTPEGDAIDPRWSPDGRQIVFVQVPRGRETPGPRIISVMNADGSNVRSLSK